MADLSTSTHDGQSEQTAQSLITQHIDIWTTAIEQKSSAGRGTSNKFSLYGIKKLRELILELAVRGKLVPQDVNDSSVDILLSKIAEQRVILESEKKIRPLSKSLTIKNLDHPFPIPSSWQFVRFGDLTFNRDGERKPISADDRKSMQGDYDYYGASGVIDSINGYLFDKPLLLIGEDGANLISRSTPIAFIAKGKFWVNNHAHVIDAVSIDFLNYLALFINAISLEPYITGTAQPKMNQAKMNSIIIAIPPTEEQHRIVAKVDELMSLCDALEAQTEASIAAHQTLVETLLNALLQPNTTQPADSQSACAEPALIPSVAECFAQSWQRVAEHFDTLFTTAASIDTLKQTILQLAVMGKLVEQDPNDETAAKLLERIAKEKAQLIKDGKIKKQKPLPAITDEEKPFELPQGWEWCYLQDLFSVVTDGDHQAPPKAESGIPFLVIGNLNTGSVRFENSKFVPNEYYEKLDWSRQPRVGDLLYTVTGSYGIPIIVNENKPFCVQRHVAILNSSSFTPIEYVCYVLSSKYSYEFATSVATGIAQKTVPLSGLRRMPIPLPPTSEVNHIVAKVDELMALCDQLKARLSDAQTTQLHLTDAIVEQAI
ncbi:restriction endonuclease subunit S [Shewanella holmiensis]|uniref:Restriction endonuclease subunit S n=1 Tax=Shewanella holmiensis TaxID=2952222 RepID=A0A9X3ARL7_9GAMM|nr:restriction endonuclease subunit S [Shewanella holmiensis]MCT7943621.1 restriction endonuclease subunit S [Shewanella holmiensis]